MRALTRNRGLASVACNETQQFSVVIDFWGGILTPHNTSASTSCKSRNKVLFGDVPSGEGVESLSEWLIKP